MSLDMYRAAAAAAIGFNDPKGVAKLEPRKHIEVDLEKVHPMLRPVRNRG
jgi:hypothetical protein